MTRLTRQPNNKGCLSSLMDGVPVTPRWEGIEAIPSVGHLLVEDIACKMQRLVLYFRKKYLMLVKIIVKNVVKISTKKVTYFF